jgi:hypothetical protein
MASPDIFFHGENNPCHSTQIISHDGKYNIRIVGSSGVTVIGNHLTVHVGNDGVSVVGETTPLPINHETQTDQHVPAIHENLTQPSNFAFPRSYISRDQLSTADPLKMSHEYLVRVRAGVLFENGFGYQDPACSTSHCFVLACLSDTSLSLDDFISQLRDQSGSNSVEIQDFLGFYSLKVHWTEYHKRNDILNACLKLNQSFDVFCGHGITVRFDASIDAVYHGDIVEEKLIELAKSVYRVNHILRRTDPNLGTVPWSRFQDVWNWHSAKGIDFCAEFCKENGVLLKATDSPKIIIYGQFSKTVILIHCRTKSTRTSFDFAGNQRESCNLLVVDVINFISRFKHLIQRQRPNPIKTQLPKLQSQMPNLL